MYFSLLAAVLASSIYAAAVGEQACHATVTTTVTPPPITANREEQHYSYRSTTTCTRLALQSSASPSSSPQATAAAKRDCAGAQTVTVTAQPSTTKITRTVTYRQAATRTTATAPACEATNNFGLFKGTINMDSRTASQRLPEVRTYANITIEECCQACFKSTDGCMAWSFNGSVSNGEPVAGCSLSMVSNGCPASQGTQMIMYYNDEKPLVGVGSCGVEVQTF